MSNTGCKISSTRRIATTGTIYDVAADHPMNVAVTVGEVSPLPSDFSVEMKHGSLTNIVMRNHLLLYNSLLVYPIS